jgi:hypothetical protein
MLMIYLATLLGMTSFLIIRALPIWLVKIGPSLDMFFFKVISLTKHKA